MRCLLLHNHRKSINKPLEVGRISQNAAADVHICAHTVLI